MNYSTDILQLIGHAGSVVTFVMLLLLFFSITSWAVIFLKFKLLSKSKKESLQFLDIFWNSRRLDNIFENCKKLETTPLAEMFKAGYIELINIQNAKKQSDTNAPDVMSVEISGIDNISRALRRAAIQETTILEQWISFLATTSSSAPFIGLFGTVWGIMTSFINIGATKDTSLAVVAPGISEALIATAMGLFAAIPAAIFYNVFVSKIRVISNEMENFSSDFLNILKRNFFLKGD